MILNKLIIHILSRLVTPFASWLDIFSDFNIGKSHVFDSGFYDDLFKLILIFLHKVIIEIEVQVAFLNNMCQINLFL